MKKIMLIDGNSLIHRAFHALPPLMTSKGVHTNAVYGFMNMLMRILKEQRPDYIAVAFDKKSPTFRHQEFIEYKANRVRTPEELVGQFDVLKQILKAMNIRYIEIDGYEADDILGSLSKKAEEAGIFTLIVTGDKDTLQLVSPMVHVMLTRKGISEMEIYDPDKMAERFGIPPQAIPDMKGLMGDSSDNIPGIPGVGEKTALKLLQEYGSLENILENAEKLKGKLRENILKYGEQARVSKRLATIVRDVELDVDLEEIALTEPDYAELLKIFRELEFYTLINKLPRPQEKEEHPEKLSCTVIDYSGFGRMMERVRAAGVLAVELKTDGRNPMDAHLIGIGFSPSRGEGFYVPAEVLEKSPEVKSDLKAVLADPGITKIIHDGKYARTVLAKIGMDFVYNFDTMLAAYLLDPSKPRYDLESVVFDNLGVELKGTEDPGRRVAYLIPLKEIMSEKLKSCAMEELFFGVEMPLSFVLSDMEMTGIKVDPEKLESLSREFGEKLEELTGEIYRLAGVEFNINSPKQLGEVLFEKLNLPVIKKKKSGYSTDAEVLEKLKNAHPVVEKILEYRFLMKMKSTYADGLLALVDKSTYRIHSNFNQTITATGRISSTEPNLQNIPVKTDIGRKIRGVFVAESPEHVLLSGDYSQIELRVLAHLSGDEGLIEAFIKGEDIHTRTASEVFGVPPEQVTPLLRDRAKAVNFGIIYGISDYGLAQNLGISTAEAREYIENYLNRYPKVRDYIRETIRNARMSGYVTTILNRRRYIPEINSRNYNLRSFAERVAMNTPIQGSAADIIKVAMVKITNHFREYGLKAKMLIQVHDELIFDVPKSELEVVKNIVKDDMENAIPLKVPLVVDFKEGYTWEEIS
ncbi:DNA polymerase I [Thermosediminibacter oceani]|uniref:DNA polymerase I n=1 Tax=Thermosediminibacter oceani (strain ATCC BAA-1034 / DSM 16646 / JW/IW-1228P) TaxID=555079 RepID=D9RYG6_THEOJ|nr:DNA polymerase I [Thermosediminibacter oceani]ADL08390.1 DNA polymerase I [Thermosediminibacter oceani DSM 16646]